MVYREMHESLSSTFVGNMISQLNSLTRLWGLNIVPHWLIWYGAPDMVTVINLDLDFERMHSLHFLPQFRCTKRARVQLYVSLLSGYFTFPFFSVLQWWRNVNPACWRLVLLSSRRLNIGTLNLPVRCVCAL